MPAVTPKVYFCGGLMRWLRKTGERVLMKELPIFDNIYNLCSTVATQRCTSKDSNVCFDQIVINQLNVLHMYVGNPCHLMMFRWSHLIKFCFTCPVLSNSSSESTTSSPHQSDSPGELQGVQTCPPPPHKNNRGLKPHFPLLPGYLHAS